MHVLLMLCARLVAVLVGLLVLGAVLMSAHAATRPAASATSVGKVYWIEVQGGMDRIMRSNLDGSAVEELVSEEMGGVLFEIPALAIDVPREKIYWTNPVMGEIRRANVDGTGVESVVAVPTTGGLAIDSAGGKIYWTTGEAFPDPEMVERSDLDGSNRETLAQAGRSFGLALDISAGHIYYSRGTSIWRADLDGSNASLFAESPPFTGFIQIPYVVDIELDGPDVYWTVEHPGVAFCIPSGCGMLDFREQAVRKLAGGPVEKLRQSGAFGIAIDEAKGVLYSGEGRDVSISHLNFAAPAKLVSLSNIISRVSDIELDVFETFATRTPTITPTPTDTPTPTLTPDPVGGVALDQELRALPAATSQTSDSGSVALVAGAALIGLASLGGAAWWGRRRRLRRLRRP